MSKIEFVPVILSTTHHYVICSPYVLIRKRPSIGILCNTRLAISVQLIATGEAVVLVHKLQWNERRAYRYRILTLCTYILSVRVKLYDLHKPKPRSIKFDMAIFAVIQQPGANSHRLGQSVRERFRSAHYDLSDGVWLIYGPQTAEEASAALGITPHAENGTGLVLEVGSYYGRANPAIWSWLKNNWEAKPIG